MLPDEIVIYDLDTRTLKKSILPIIRIVRKLKPAIIYSTFGYINIPLLACRWLLPSGIMIWIREANLPSISLDNNPHPYFMKLAYYFLYRSSDRVFCTSHLMRKELTLNFNVPELKISLLTNPVDEENIHLNIAYVKRKNSKGLNFVAAGRLTYQKGFDRLLLWFSSLNNSNNTLTILGDGPLKRSLKADIQELGIQNQVTLGGFVDNPWQYYAEADAFILPSRWEGMSNAALEALSCGTIVISTSSSGGIKEVQKEAVRNSIIIVDSGDEFIQTVNNLALKKESSINPSLLPKKYKLEISVLTLEKFINCIDFD
jgi:glycosyltransferase involved in cell wall biosynthesis